MLEEINPIPQFANVYAAMFTYEVSDEALEMAAENGLGGRCSCKPCKSKCSLDTRL
jgi:hypothetical protein